MREMHFRNVDALLEDVLYGFRNFEEASRAA